MPIGAGAMVQLWYSGLLSFNYDWLTYSMIYCSSFLFDQLMALFSTVAITSETGVLNGLPQVPRKSHQHCTANASFTGGQLCVCSITRPKTRKRSYNVRP